jgi:hypothetical protein
LCISRKKAGAILLPPLSKETQWHGNNFKDTVNICVIPWPFYKLNHKGTESTKAFPSRALRLGGFVIATENTA